MVTKWQVPEAPARAGKSTMLGVQAPKAAPTGTAPAADDSWDVAPTRVEERSPQATPVAPTAAAPTQAAAPVTPVAPLAAPVAPAGLNASDVRLIVRTIVEDALLPLQRALVEAQQRIAELERRPAPAAPTVILSPTPAPAATAPAAYTSAMAAPARTAPVQHSTVPLQYSTAPPAPLLDVAAIERDIPLDFNNPFDGARRRRRMAWFVVVALLAIFGGLFALLADSYTPHH
jgi:hypothetical protein